MTRKPKPKVERKPKPKKFGDYQFWFKKWEPKKFTKKEKECMDFKKFFQHIKNIDTNHKFDNFFHNSTARSRFIQDFTNKVLTNYYIKDNEILLCVCSFLNFTESKNENKKLDMLNNSFKENKMPDIIKIIKNSL